MNRTAHTAGSLNPDIDSYFYPNCIGLAVDKADPPGRIIHMNPPFAEAILIKSLYAIGRWLARSPDLTIILIIPAWDNTPSCNYLDELVKLKKYITHCFWLPGGNHLFELDDQPFIPPNDTLVVTFGEVKLIKRLQKAFLTYASQV